MINFTTYREQKLRSIDGYQECRKTDRLLIIYLYVERKKKRGQHVDVPASLDIYTVRRGLEPTNVAEVLTVRQVYILGIHTVCNLEGTSVIYAMDALEGVDVILLLHEVQGINAVDVLLAL